jgi:hypothetical protein
MKLGGILTALLGTPMMLTAIYMFANLINGLLFTGNWGFGTGSNWLILSAWL